jgi:hypothetical protein
MVFYVSPAKKGLTMINKDTVACDLCGTPINARNTPQKIQRLAKAYENGICWPVIWHELEDNTEHGFICEPCQEREEEDD